MPTDAATKLYVYMNRDLMFLKTRQMASVTATPKVEVYWTDKDDADVFTTADVKQGLKQRDPNYHYSLDVAVVGVFKVTVKRTVTIVKQEKE